MSHRYAAAKISGESLAGDNIGSHGVSDTAVARVADDIVKVLDTAPDCCLTLGIGGGNFWRGRNGGRSSNTSDAIGRMCTAFNVVFLSEHLDERGVPNVRLLAPTMHIADERADLGFQRFSPEAIAAAHHRGAVVLLAGGLGHNGVTTDSGTTHCAGVYAEYRRQLGDAATTNVVKFTKADGVYERDPREAAPGEQIRRYQVISAVAMEADYTQLAAVDRDSLRKLQEYGLTMHVVGNEHSLADALRMSPYEAVALGMGTLILPHAAEARFHDPELPEYAA